MRYLTLLFLGICNSFRYHYGSLYRRELKKRYRIQGLVEDHHIIPKQFTKHHILEKYNYNISAPYNIMMLPNKKGQEFLNTNRLLHSGGHSKYNKYVEEKLEDIENEEDLDNLVQYLRLQMYGNPYNIPWK